MWGKILIGIIVVTLLIYGLGIFLRGSSSSFVQAKVDQAYKEMEEVATALRRTFTKFDQGDMGEDPRYEEFEIGRADKLWPETFSGFLNVKDPFDPEGGFYLMATLDDFFVVISPGPNKYIDIQPVLLEEAMRSETGLEETLGPWTYDPDNGTTSDGDLFVYQRFGH